MRQSSKMRLSEDESHPVRHKSNGVIVDETATTSIQQKSEVGAAVKIPKLDMSKVVTHKPETDHKPQQQGQPKPDEPELKEDRNKPRESEKKLSELKEIPKTQQSPPTKADSPEKRMRDPSPKNAISIMNKLKFETAAQSNVPQNKVEEQKPEPQGNVTPTKKAQNEEYKIVFTDPPSEKKQEPAREHKLVVGPDIFVSLKTGSISDQYKVGQVLGEGIRQTSNRRKLM